MKTACEYCLFKQTDNGIQTGCAANRLSKFKSAGQANLVNNSYEISNFCNMCKNVYWSQYQGEKNINRLVELAREEAKITYDALINIDGTTTEKIKKTLKHIDKLQYNPPSKIFLFGEMNEANIKLMDGFQSKDIAVSLHISTDKFTQSNKYVHQTLANYLLFLSPGIKFGIDIPKVDKQMNDELRPMCYLNGESCFLVSTQFYKQHIVYDNPIKTIIENYDEYGKSKG